MVEQKMIAYSEKAKPLAEKAIDSLVGCSVVLIADKTYYTKAKCSKEYLSKIHERGWPYLLAKNIVRNDSVLEGALNPRYVVVDIGGQVMISGRKIIEIDKFENVDGVMYSDTKWNKPKFEIIKPVKSNGGYDENTTNLLDMGTQNYQPLYITWDCDKKRWYYSACKQEKLDYSYPGMFITREGFLNWRTKPDLYAMKLTDGKNKKEDVKIACQWCANEIQETKKLIQTNGCSGREEYEEYRMQMCALWLLSETCKNLYKANKKIDTNNLSAIIDSIQVSTIKSISVNTLPQYMYIYMHDILELVA